MVGNVNQHTTRQVDRDRATETGRGRHATDPGQISFEGWKDILWRTLQQVGNDRVTLVAAAVTYYMLLSMFPAMTAFVSVYGLFVDPQIVTSHVSLLSNIVPSGGLDIIRGELTRLAESGGTELSFALLISLGLALWSSSAAVRALFEAMNVAYGEREKRNFFVVSALSFLFILGGIVAGAAVVAIVVVIPVVIGFIGLGTGPEWLIQGAAYLVLVIILLGGVALLYRYGPSRNRAKWRWITPGAVACVVGLLIVSALFSWYAANFANFDKTYGSLGALIGLLTWIWISMNLIIIGAELDSEVEHQTAVDSTTGEEKPLGDRDATVADTVGRSLEEGGTPSHGDRPGRRRVRDDAETRSPSSARAGPSLATMAVILPLSLLLAGIFRRRRADSE